MLINSRQRLLPSQHPLNILHGQPLKPNLRLHRPSPIMARQHHIPHLRQLGMDVRLVRMHVQPGSEDLPGLESSDEGVLIDQLAARDVHEPRPLLEMPQEVCVDEPRAGEGRREDDAVGPRDELLVRGAEDSLNAALLLLALAHDVVVVDLHAEREVGLLRDRVADGAQSDDAQDAAARVPGRQGRVVVRLQPLLGVARSRGEMRPGQVAEDGDDVEEGCVGDGFCGRGAAVAVEDAFTVLVLILKEASFSS